MKTICALALAAAAFPLTARAEAPDGVAAQVEAVADARRARENAVRDVEEARTALSRLRGNGDRAAIDAAAAALDAAKAEWKAQQVVFTEAKAALRAARASG